MSMRRLCLGSVSSLSFEEEEHDHNFFSEASSEASLGSSGSGGDVVGVGIHPQQHPVSSEDQGGHELTRLLTDRLEEQVDILLRVSYGDDLMTSLGLHQTLRLAVHDILHLSEEEPYGVRGATIILKMRPFKAEEDKYLGTILVDTSTVSTFRLILVLQEERRLGVAIRNWLGQLFIAGKQAHVISSQYKLHKEKLYRSSSGGSKIKKNSR